MRDSIAAVLAARAPWTVEEGHVIEVLHDLPDECIQVCVTSPPYFGLRSYKTDPLVWGDDPTCQHEWDHHRYYVEGGGGEASAEAFTQPGPGNVERLKKARWHEDDTCPKCGAWRGHLGLERTPEEYVAHLVEIFRDVRRVLRHDGVLFLNLGDSYAAAGYSNHKNTGGVQRENGGKPRHLSGTGLKPKDLVGIPWRVAFALQADGWWLRSDVIWAKPNPMPESMTDRPTKSHEYVFLLTKNERYFYDHLAILEPFADERQGRDGAKAPSERNRGGRTDGFTKPNGIDPSANGGRNKRTVWTISAEQWPEAHFAVMPTALVEPCIKAGTSEKGACAKCGAPWERVTERTNEPDETAKGSRFDTGKTGARDGGDRTQPGERFKKRFVGWCPTCEHKDADQIPSLVLDPFAGSGTVGVVARKLGRRFLGVELSPDYVEMARRRIGDTAPLLDAIPMVTPKDPMEEAQIPLLPGA